MSTMSSPGNQAGIPEGYCAIPINEAELGAAVRLCVLAKEAPDPAAGQLILLRDLPDAFDAKMREYLGLQPPDVVVGVLQDVHWSDMSMGYFPTYALGNVVSVQLWERATADLGDLDEQFERGEFAALREWLRENVHRHGRAFTPQELLQRGYPVALRPGGRPGGHRLDVLLDGLPAEVQPARGAGCRRRRMGYPGEGGPDV